MTPVIAMPACYAAPAQLQAMEDAVFPELPVLSTMLHGAKSLPPASDWRSAVLAALGIPDAQQHSQALIAARALDPLPNASGVCLAMPIHAVAGMSRMFLAPPQSFELDAAEREELRMAFNAEFGAADVHMHAAGTGWLLQSPAAFAADDGSPESLLGEALTRKPAVSAALRSLRLLGAEVEMWLAGLSFNSARERRGVPPINSIWFWSGAALAEVPAPTQMPGGLFTNADPDAWLAGLAAHCGLPLQIVGGWKQVRDTPGALVILQPQQMGAVMQQLPAWESAWFAPALDDLAARRLPALQLQIGRGAWSLPAPVLSRWMQRRRPWWQKVCA